MLFPLQASVLEVRLKSRYTFALRLGDLPSLLAFGELQFQLAPKGNAFLNYAAIEQVNYGDGIQCFFWLHNQVGFSQESVHDVFNEVVMPCERFLVMATKRKYPGYNVRLISPKGGIYMQFRNR